MAATLFNHGRQAEELVEVGLMRDLTDMAEADGWKVVVHPSSLLDACTVDGRIYKTTGIDTGRRQRAARAGGLA